MPSHDLAFGEFWSAYPRKVAKPDARKAWGEVMRRGVDPGDVVAGARRYAADPNREAQFTKYPAGWLRAGHWNDPPLPPRTGDMTRTERVMARVVGGAPPPIDYGAFYDGPPAIDVGGVR